MSPYIGFKPKGAIRVYSPLRDLNYCCAIIVSDAFKQVEREHAGDERAMSALGDLAVEAAAFFNKAKSASEGSVADVLRDFLAGVENVIAAEGGGQVISEFLGAVVTGMLARYASGVRESTDVAEEKEPEVIKFLEQTSILARLPVDAAKDVEVALRGNNLWSEIGDREGTFIEVADSGPDRSALERLVENLKKEAEKAGVSVEELIRK